MVWTHCSRDTIADDTGCPACGLTKEAWTLTVNATRTFVVSNKGRGKREKTAWIEVELAGGAGATCELELPDGQIVKAAVDDAGLLRQEQLYPGECRVRFPGRAIEAAQGEQDADGWTPCETGVRHPFRWREGAVKVASPARTHVQWVNLSVDAEDASRGNVLKLTLVGSAGQAAFARLERGAKSSARLEPSPGIVGATDDVLALTIADGGRASAEIDLGLAGGDAFTLRVGRTAACGDDHVEVTNWRRISCQLTTRRGKPLPALSAMIAALEDVFIEFEVYRELLIDEGDPSLPPGSWLDASERSSIRTGQRLIAGNHNVAALKQKYDQLKSPAGVHLIVVDESFDAFKVGTREPCTVTLGQVITAREAHLTHSEDGVDPPRRRGAKAMLIFNKSLLDGQPSFIDGTWESKAPPGHPDHGKSGAIVAEDIKKIRFSRVTLELVRDDLSIDVGSPVLVRLRLHALTDGNLGKAESQQMTVVQGSDDVDPLFWSSTVMHELGHVLHQAGIDVAPGLSSGGHDRLYLERGHTGHHCGFGLTDEEWASLYYAGLKGSCLMFGEVTDPPNLKFCEKCRPFILADACQSIYGPKGLPVKPAGGA